MLIEGYQEQENVEKINPTTTKIMMSQEIRKKDILMIFRKYINYGYTCDRTTTKDMMSININNTAATNEKQELHQIASKKERCHSN